MTTKQELESQAAKLRAELEQLDTKIAAMPDDTPEWPWRPQHDKKYWWPDSCGRALASYWENDSTDIHRFARGNVFATKEEAERRAELIRLMQPKCARPKKGDRGWRVVFRYSPDCYLVEDTPTAWSEQKLPIAWWEMGLWFPVSQRTEAEAHAKALNDFFSQEDKR